MITRTGGRVATALLAGVLAAGCTATDAAPSSSPDGPGRTPTPLVSERQLTLPEPTGSRPTGTTLLALTDPARRDDGTPGPREVLTQFWYPTTASGGPTAPYAPDAEAAAMAAFYPVPPGAFAPASTHSAPDRPAAPGARPLVLLTHGLCGNRTDLTALAEQLASEGMVVAATANTGEAGAVAFPDGRVVPPTDIRDCATASDSNSPAGIATIERLQRTRVADQRFVLDTVARRAGLPRGLDAAVDPSRVVAIGHSFGGSTMVALARADTRVDAAVDLDGFLLGPDASTPLDKPVLVLGSETHTPEGDPSWRPALPALRDLTWLRLRGVGHYRFVDVGPDAERWGLRAQMDPGTWASIFGDTPGPRAQQLVLRYTTAFVHRVVDRTAAPILREPTDPEVIVGWTSPAR